MDTQTTETDQQKELSRQWIDRLCSGRGLEGAWRLQLIGQRSRVLGTCDDAGWLTDEAGEYYVGLDGGRLAPTAGTEVAPDGTISAGVRAVRAIDSTRPMRIRRFAKGIPASCVDEAIRHLLAKAPYTGLVFNGTPIDGTYVPTHTWWEREDRDTVDRGKYVDNVYTLFQDLWDRDRGDADDVSPSGCSCTEETSTRYVHDAFSVESVECRGQGYSVAIQSAGRNEDGTYDYSVVTRRALTQVSGPTVLKCDEFETVRETTWRNAYGSPGAWTDQDGNPVAVPPPCSAAPGTMYDVTSRQNDDCTYDVTVRETVSNNVGPSGLRTSATIYQADREESSSAEDSPPDEVDSASDGVVRTNEHTLRPDGKYDVKRRVQTETPVSSSSKRRSKYLDGTVVETVSRNQTPAYGASALSRGLRPGESVEVRKTDGDLRDVTVVEVDADPVGEKADDCRDTLYQHDHSETVNQASAPSRDHVPAASGGVVTRVRSQLTDRGTYDVVTDVAAEHPVSGAETRRTRTLDGVVVETTDRSQPKAAGAAALAEGLAVGASVSVRRTDGDLCDITRTSVDADPVGEKADDCRDTLYQHDHSETVNQASAPSRDHVPAASGGVVTRVRSQLTDRGTYDVVTDVAAEHPVSGAEVRRTKTLDGVVVETTDRSQPKAAGDAARSESLAVGESVTVRRTDGDLCDITRTAVDAEPVGLKSEECSDTAFLHQHSTVTNQAAPPSPSEVPPASGGLVGQLQARLTDRGTYDVMSGTRQEHTVPSAVVRKSRTLDGLLVETTDRSMPEPGGDPEAVGETVESSVTDGHLFDVKRSVLEDVEEDGDLARKCSLSALEHRTVTTQRAGKEDPGDDMHARAVDTSQRTWNELDYDLQQTGVWRKTDTEHRLIRHEWDAEVCLELCYSYDVWFRNDTYEEYHDLLARVQAYLADCVRKWTQENRPPAGYSCNPSIQINDGQLYDGHIAIRAEWAAGSAGMTGETEGIEMAVTFAGTYNVGFKAMGRGIETLHKILNSYGTTDWSVGEGYGLRHTASFDWRPSSGTWTVDIDLSACAKSDRLGPVHLHTDSSLPVLQHTVSDALGPAGKPSLVL